MVLELHLQTRITDSGLYEVTFARPKAPLDVQELAFTAYQLENVSPAQLAFLRVNVRDGTFDEYSRTRGRVIHDDRDGGKGFVVFPNGLGTSVRTADIVAAHRVNREYVIPDGQKDEIYGLIDSALTNNAAVRVGYGKITVPTSRFGDEGLTSILYTEPILGAKAQDYGDHINEIVPNGFFDEFDHKYTDGFFLFDKKEYAQQNGLYVNGLRLYSSHNRNFNASGIFRYLSSIVAEPKDSGAFGVRFKKVDEGGVINPEALKK